MSGASPGLTLEQGRDLADMKLGKVATGIGLSRLHAAVARAALGTIFADGFESGSTDAWAVVVP